MPWDCSSSLYAIAQTYAFSSPQIHRLHPCISTYRIRGPSAMMRPRSSTITRSA